MWACVAALAQPATFKPLQESSVGKIFLTPEQRLLIDKTTSTPNESGVRNDSHSSTSTKTIHGVVRRSDGHTVVWVNGKMQLHAN
jgi:hypothetical protein